MNLSVWYNSHDVELALPESARVTLYDLPGRKLSAIGQDHWLNRGEPPDDLKKFLRASGKLLIVINDLFRPTPTARILKALRTELKIESTQVLVATGLHPAKTSADAGLLLGELALELGPKLHVHDAFDDAGLVEFDGVRLNKLFAWCDSILIIGSVEPHYFAGFTGGRKIILPGCASFEDVRRNHGMAVEAASQPLSRKGNPVWEDIQARTVCLDGKARYAIQLVCDHDRNVHFASSGDWEVSYNRACEFVIANYAHWVAEPFDVVVSVVYPPLDRNLYQLQKSYENVAVALRNGGTILLISSCRDGVGDDRFLKIAAALARGESASGGSGEDSVMGIHKVRRTQRIAERINLVLCSTLEGSVLQDLPITPRSDISSALSELFDRYGRNLRIAVVLDAASQVLYRHVA